MNHLLQILLIILSLNSFLDAQNTTNRKFYRTWIYLNDAPYKVDGALYELKDSSILLSDSYNFQDYTQNNYTVSEYPIQDIKVIKIRRKNQKGKAVIIGAIIGTIIGGSIAYLSDDYQNCDPYSTSPCDPYNNGILIASGMAAGAIYGSLLGLAIGSIKVTVPLKGRNRNYRKYYKKMKKFPLVQY